MVNTFKKLFLVSTLITLSSTNFVIAMDDDLDVNTDLEIIGDNTPRQDASANSSLSSSMQLAQAHKQVFSNSSLLSSPMDIDQQDGKTQSTSYSNFSSVATTVKPAEVLQKNAIYGNKTANLCVLKDIISQPSLQNKVKQYGVRVSIPEFLGISSDDVKLFLQSLVPNLDKKIEETYKEQNEDKFLKRLEEIGALIAGAQVKEGEQINFDKEVQQSLSSTGGGNLVGRKRTCSEAGLTSEVERPSKRSNTPIDVFIEEARRKGWRLMVRSSGQEDTKNCSNAGGNHTEINVTPERNAIDRAMCNVVASYFSKKSLEQRKESGENIRLTKPHYAVLLQRMIGEKANAKTEEIPVGCVVYTQEAKGRTSGITHIQASFGHNEGVVDSKVEVDTYYVGPKTQINKRIKNKPERLVPLQTSDGKYGLEFKDNGKELENKSALDDNALLAIKAVADEIEITYRMPMDIELVYERHTKTIYLVQARPLVYSSKKENPSYIKDVKKYAQKVQCSTLIPDDFSVKHITTADQIIVAQTLDEALEKFMTKTDKQKTDEQFDQQKKVQVVAVKGNALETSHAAANFRHFGKAVVIIPKIEIINQWLTQEPLSLWIDVQQGIVVSTPTCDSEQGYCKHPIDQYVSIPQSITQQYEISRSFSEYYPAVPLENLIKMIWNAKDKELCCKVLDSLRYRIFVAFSGQQNNQRAEILFRYVYYLMAQIIEYFDQPRLRAYFTNFLEAALIQERISGDVDCYSFRSLDTKNWSNEVCIKQISDESMRHMIQKYPDLLDIAQKGCAVALSPELEKYWLKVITYVAHNQNADNEKLKKSFVALISKIQSLDALSGWMNVFLDPALDKPEEIKSIIERYSYEMNVYKDILEEMLNIEKALACYDSKKWEDPESFEKVCEDFKNRFLKFFVDDKLKKYLDEKGNVFVKIFLLNLIEHFVDVFDRSIKSLTSSNKYKNKDQHVKNFKQVLVPYFSLLESFDIGKNLHYVVASKSISTRKKIKERFDQISSTGAEQFLPSKDFSAVNSIAACTGSGFDRALPKTLEDMFTFIHRSLLWWIAKAMPLSVLKKKQAPKLFNDINKVLLDLKSTYFQGVKYNGSRIIARYQVSMANHGVCLKLSADKNGPDARIEFMFFGNNRDRWPLIKDFVWRFLDLIDGVNLDRDSVVEKSCELCFMLKISHNCDLDNLLPCIAFMFSTAGDWSVGKSYKPLSSVISLARVKNVLEKNPQYLIEGISSVFSRINSANIIWSKIVEKCAECIQDGQLCEEIKYIAHAAIKCVDIKEYGIALIRLLFEKGFVTIEEAKKIAEQAMSSKWYYDAAERLILSLFERGVVKAEEIEKIAGDALASKRLGFCITLTQALFAKSCIPAQRIIELIEKTKSTPDYAIDLFTMLLKTKLSDGEYDQLEKIACDFTTRDSASDPYNELGSLGTKLFEKLFEYGKAYEKAIEIAQLCVSNGSHNGNILFEFLFKHKKAIQEGIKTAQDSMKSADDRLRELGILLIKELFKQDLIGQDMVKEQALIAIHDKNKYVRSYGLDLIKELYDKNCITNQDAITVLQCTSSDFDVEIQKLSVYFWKKVLQKGYDKDVFCAALKIKPRELLEELTAILMNNKECLDFVIDRASKAAQENSQNIGLQNIGLIETLFKSLFDKLRILIENGQFDMALGVAQDLVHIPNKMISDLGIQLFDLLMKKGSVLAFDNALLISIDFDWTSPTSNMISTRPRYVRDY